MTFKYIWATIKTEKNLPLGLDFKTRNLKYEDYIFYPFNFEKEISTIDLSVWNINQKNIALDLKEISFWPDLIKIHNFFTESKEIEISNNKFFLVLSNKSHAQTIDPACEVPLFNINEIAELQDKFSFLGYDVIDTSGLSAVVNIGYSKDELLKIKNEKIEINNFGIISSLIDAAKFAQMADLFAGEHAPFSPVEVWDAGGVFD
jgi:hypothetical protein